MSCPIQERIVMEKGRFSNMVIRDGIRGGVVKTVISPSLGLISTGKARWE